MHFLFVVGNQRVLLSVRCKLCALCMAAEHAAVWRKGPTEWDQRIGHIDDTETSRIMHENAETTGSGKGSLGE